jgi:hypothetical protein
MIMYIELERTEEEVTMTCFKELCTFAVSVRKNHEQISIRIVSARSRHERCIYHSQVTCISVGANCFNGYIIMKHVMTVNYEFGGTTESHHDLFYGNSLQCL